MEPFAVKTRSLTSSPRTIAVIRAAVLTLSPVLFGGCTTFPPQITVSTPESLQGHSENAKLLAVVWKDLEPELKRWHDQAATIVFEGDPQPKKSIWIRREKVSCNLKLAHRGRRSAKVDVSIVADASMVCYFYELVIKNGVWTISTKDWIAT
jgi:hypothetical protein